MATFAFSDIDGQFYRKGNTRGTFTNRARTNYKPFVSSHTGIDYVEKDMARTLGTATNAGQLPLLRGTQFVTGQTTIGSMGMPVLGTVMGTSTTLTGVEGAAANFRRRINIGFGTEAGFARDLSREVLDDAMTKADEAASSIATIGRRSISAEISSPSIIKAVLRGVKRIGLWGFILDKFVSKILNLEKSLITRRIIQSVKHFFKRVSKETVKGHAKLQLAGTADLVSRVKLNAEVDTSRFDRAMREYMRYTSKDLTEAINQKAFNIALKAFKYTYAADKGTIGASLSANSDKFPGLSVAEAIALDRLRKKGIGRPTKSELNAEARKTINLRKGASKFLKSGWIPAIKALSRVVPQKGSYVQAELGGKRKPKGGATSASPIFSLNKEATLWNSIFADGDGKARKYLTQGLQQAMDEEAADMEAYIRRKIEKNNERFNR